MEKDTKKDEKLIKFLVKGLDMGVQLDKILPEQMSKVDFECSDKDDARLGYLIFESDIVSDSRMIKQSNSTLYIEATLPSITD